MLPNANAVAVAFMALQAAGRVPAMLNYTSGRAQISSPPAKRRAIRLVLTSRAFIDKAALAATDRGDRGAVRASSGSRTCATARHVGQAHRGADGAGAPLARREPDDPAVVLFTSGSEGAPKGVALSHANLLANIAQIEASSISGAPISASTRCRSSTPSV